MAIIKNKNIQKKQQIKLKINEETLNQIRQYCEWSGIFDIGYFIEKSAHHVFKKDPDWNAFKKEKTPIDA
jgi:hypothetical protein